MEKRQQLLVGVAVGALMIGAGVYYWLQHSEEPMPSPVVTTPSPSKPAKPTSSLPATQVAPGARVTTSNTRDNISINEEELDRLKAEQKDLRSRQQDLDAQLSDSDSLIKLKQEQIKQMQQKLATPGQ